jgi:hypothetical protein
MGLDQGRKSILVLGTFYPAREVKSSPVPPVEEKKGAEIIVVSRDRKRILSLFANDLGW